MANIPNTFQRLDDPPILPETVVISTTETEFNCKRMMPAKTIKPKGSFSLIHRGYLVTGTSIGGLVLRNYLGSKLLTTTTPLAVTANLLAAQSSGFWFQVDFDINADGTINAQGQGVISIAGIMANVIMAGTSFLTADLTTDNLLRSTVQATGALVGSSSLNVRMNQLRSTI